MKGILLGRRRLAAVSGIVTPNTILRWYRGSSPRNTTGPTRDGNAALKNALVCGSCRAPLAALHRRMPASSCWAGCVPRSGMSRRSWTTLPNAGNAWRDACGVVSPLAAAMVLAPKLSAFATEIPRRRSTSAAQFPDAERRDNVNPSNHSTHRHGFREDRLLGGHMLSVRLSELSCHLRGGSCLGRFRLSEKPSTQTQLAVDSRPTSAHRDELWYDARRSPEGGARVSTKALVEQGTSPGARAGAPSWPPSAPGDSGVFATCEKTTC